MPVLISGVDLDAAVAVASAALTLVVMVTLLSIATKILHIQLHWQFRDGRGKIAVVGILGSLVLVALSVVITVWLPLRWSITSAEQ